MKRSYFESNSALNYSLLNTNTPTRLIATTSLELPQNVRNGNSGNIIEGYFKAPITSNYRFHMSCDDVCQLSLST